MEGSDRCFCTDLRVPSKTEYHCLFTTFSTDISTNFWWKQTSAVHSFLSVRSCLHVRSCAMIIVFLHAEWIRKPEPSGLKNNTEETVSKNKRLCEDDKPFLEVTRKKILETLFKQSKLENEKPDDSENRVASTTL